MYGDPWNDFFTSYLGAKSLWPISWNPGMSLMGCLQVYMMLCILKVFMLMNWISYSVWQMFTFWKPCFIYNLSLKECSSVKMTKWPACVQSVWYVTLLAHHWNLWQHHLYRCFSGLVTFRPELKFIGDQ